MNLPNKLTVLRICFVPFIVFFMLWSGWLGQYSFLTATLLFVLASVTDLADGHIARKYNLVTDLGKFLDPLADKLLVLSVMIVLNQLNRISAVLTIIIYLRDLCVNGVRMLAAGKGLVVAANPVGKWKTVTQMIGLTGIMLGLSFSQMEAASHWVNLASGLGCVGDIFLLISVVLAIISVIQYIWHNRKCFLETA